MILFENRANDCVVRAFAHRTGHSTADIGQIDWDGIHGWWA